MRITKKLLSMILAVVMVLGLLPATAFATESPYVYISVSFDGQYIDDKNGSPMVYVPVSLDEVKSIDLNEYGLSEYLYDPDGDGAYETTALQLIIYAHENIYGGSWSDVNFTGGAGSSYFQGGIFGFDENLNYFLNGEFSIDEALSEGSSFAVGATSDHIILEPGDFIDIASFTSYAFLWDSAAGFHLFADENDAFVHNYTAQVGEAVSVKLLRSYSNMVDGTPVLAPESGYELFYGATFGTADGTLTTDDNGCAVLSFDQAGTYYLWCNGAYGIDADTENIVSSPAYAKVTVTAGEVTPPAVSEVAKWNITLTDALTVNFYLNINPSIESTAAVVISVANTEVSYTANNLKKTEEGLYVVDVKLAAAQMTDNIVVTIKNMDTVESTQTYTIQQYAETVLTDEKLSNYHALVKEMLNYGAAAQNYFDYRVDTPANEGITGAGATNIPSNENCTLSTNGALEGVSFYGATLLFRDRIAVRYYFRIQGDTNAVSFTANGKEYTAKLKDNLYYVEIPDILPQDLDQEIELLISDASGNQMTILYSPLIYIVRMNEKGSESLQALLQALYNYHLAAKEVAALG